MSAEKGLLKSTRLIGALTMLSRVFGLVREQLLAALLGVGAQADAFNVAFRIPNLLRDLFAEGALSAAFLPTFTRVAGQRSLAEAFVLGQRVLGALFVVVGALTLVAFVFAPELVAVLAPGFEGTSGKTALTVELTRVMLPFLLVLSFAAVAMGMLNAQGVYGPPALASTAFNVVAIAFGIALYLLGYSPNETAWGWSLGVVLGGAAQFMVQLPALWRTGFRLRLRFGLDADVKAMLRLMGPAALGLAATQINLVINTQFASAYEGAPAALNYAFRLLYLPIGVFGVAIATVSTASLSRQAASADRVGVRQTVHQALALVGFLTLPSSVGLWLLSEPLIAMIYQRGAFGVAETQSVAAATAVYAIGLCSYSAVKVLAPVYYAEQRPRVALIASALAVAANVAVAFWLRAHLGFLAMALGTSVAAWVNVVVLYAALGKRPEGVSPWPMVGSLARSALSAAVMGAFGWFALRWLDRWRFVGEVGRWSLGVGLVLGCGAVFVLLAWALRIPEAQLFTGAVRRKLRR